jgi:phosphoribosylaminoimidazole-succinocarboxamide synthase
MMAQESLEETVGNMRANAIDELVGRHMPKDSYPETWAVADLVQDIQELLSLDLPIADWAKEEGIGSEEMAERIREVTLRLYSEAASFAASKGIMIADTKFEFGLDERGVLHVMDEVLTPDSSRFWPVESYAVGSNPPSYDKQYVRDWLESILWNKTPPAPALPDDVAKRTSEKYMEAFEKLTGEKLKV